jgi:hypothetical protein
MAFPRLSKRQSLSASGARGLLGLFRHQSSGNASNHIFAIELDTIQNTEFEDMSNNHIGMDVNSIISVQPFYAGYYEDNRGDF